MLAKMFKSLSEIFIKAVLCLGAAISFFALSFAQETVDLNKKTDIAPISPNSRVIFGDKTDNPFPERKGGLKKEIGKCGAVSRIGQSSINQFQALVKSSLGNELAVYGRKMFEESRQPIQTGAHFANRSDYIIGPGDQIHIKAWGQISLDYRGYVQKDGRLFVPQIGELELANIKVKNLESFVEKAISSVYSNFQLSVSLGELKPVEILVLGNALCPGNHSINGPATFITALFSTGGPSESGTLRSIQLKRNNSILKVFDLYDLMLRGDTSADMVLRSGDVIFIPPIGSQGAVYGGVKNPGIYEMDSKTTASDLINLAGGFSTIASDKPLTVERINRKTGRSIAYINLSAKGEDNKLEDGDVLRVPIISPKIDNAVTLKGNVTEVLRTPWRHNIKVSDLIPDAEMLVTAGYWQKKNQESISAPWIEDDERFVASNKNIMESGGGDSKDSRGHGNSDTDSIATQKKGVNSGSKEIEKLVTSDLDSEPATEKTVLDILRDSMAGAAVNWDYAVIERLNSKTLNVDLITFNLGKAIKEKDPAHDLLLLPGDVVTVFSAGIVGQPIDKKIRLVRLDGEFNSPGIYPVTPGETLRDLVIRVGGLTKNGYLYGAEFNRESTKNIQQQQLDKSLNRLEEEIERSGARKAATALSADDAVAAANLVDVQRSLLQRLRGIKANGRIVLSIGPRSSVFDLPEMVLEDGDKFHVPVIPSTVSVFGAVYNQNSFVYRSENSVKKYLGMAGGPTPSADSGGAYLIRANGIVWSEKQIPWYRTGLGSFALLPGDAIIVPEKLDAFSVSKELKDWSTIFYQFSLGVAGLKVLRDL